VALVWLEDIRKVYHRDGFEIPVLEHLGLQIEEREFLALMGPSGSGKSTLLNLLGGIDRPDAGRLIVGGQDITTLKPKDLARWRARHVGFIFQLSSCRCS
jgi:putative ABC transport system ATP-binding protein